MNNLLWSNGVLLAAILFVLGGMKCLGSYGTKSRFIGAGILMQASVLMIAFSSARFGSRDADAAAVAFILVYSLWFAIIANRAAPSPEIEDDDSIGTDSTG